MRPTENSREDGCRIRVEFVVVDDGRVPTAQTATHDDIEDLMPLERPFLDIVRNSLANVRQDGDRL